jgi:hypothetical protein
MPSLQTPKVVFYQGIKHDFLHHLLCKQDVHRLKPIYLPLRRMCVHVLCKVLTINKLKYGTLSVLSP